MTLMDASEQAWKDVEGYEGLYKINNFGDVYSLIKHKILSPSKHKRGYHLVLLTKNKQHKQHYVHRLVAKAFIPNPQNKIEVNHKDGNKINNSVDNLEWCTRTENSEHAYLNGLRAMQCKTPVEALDLSNGYTCVYPSMSEASRRTGINIGNISRCCNGSCKSAGGFVFKKYMSEEMI